MWNEVPTQGYATGGIEHYQHISTNIEVYNEACFCTRMLDTFLFKSILLKILLNEASLDVVSIYLCWKVQSGSWWA